MTRLRRRVGAVLPVPVFLASGAAGALAVAALRHQQPPRPTLPGARAGTLLIEGRWPDPFGHPPWNRIDQATSYRNVKLVLPPWAVATWVNTEGAICHEPGEIVNLATNPLFGNVIPQVIAKKRDRPPGWRVGAIRPDAKFGTGRQLYGLGRFLEYPIAFGGSCGYPAQGAGLIFSREVWHSRQDLGPARTIIDGIAGPRVRSVVLEHAGKRVRLALSPRRRAFIAVFKGALEPAALPLVVTYGDGRTRRFA